MLLRIKDPETGIVHFGHPIRQADTLCGQTRGVDLLGRRLSSGDPTRERVTCRHCSKVICAIRNEPYNALADGLDDETLEQGIYAAVSVDKEDKETKKGDA